MENVTSVLIHSRPCRAHWDSGATCCDHHVGGPPWCWPPDTEHPSETSSSDGKTSVRARGRRPYPVRPQRSGASTSAGCTSRPRGCFVRSASRRHELRRTSACNPSLAGGHRIAATPALQPIHTGQATAYREGYPLSGRSCGACGLPTRKCVLGALNDIVFCGESCAALGWREPVNQSVHFQDG
jgi:hypothetical protein